MASVATARYEKPRARVRVSTGTLESLGVFTAFFAAYAAIGYRVVVQQHVILFDAVVRLAHAYFVLYNKPPKLAAVGFVWPPLSTVVFLPASLLKPLATSLVALPLTTAFFGAGTVVVLLRICRLAGMPRWLAYPLVLAFAANPMIVFYSTNGMSEMVYLFLLVLSLLFFMHWFLARQPRWLLLAGVAFALGILTRYEVMSWAVFVTLVVAIALMPSTCPARSSRGQ